MKRPSSSVKDALVCIVGGSVSNWRSMDQTWEVPEQAFKASLDPEPTFLNSHRLLCHFC